MKLVVTSVGGFSFDQGDNQVFSNRNSMNYQAEIGWLLACLIALLHPYTFADYLFTVHQSE